MRTGVSFQPFVIKMKPRFKPDPVVNPASTQVFVDPESFDVSEQRFAASLESDTPARFVIDRESLTNENAEKAQQDVDDPLKGESVERALAGQRTEAGPVPTAADSDCWRQEVASKISNYRRRHRTNAPRYPSLQLKFETPEPAASQPEPTWVPSVPKVQATALQPDLPQHSPVAPDRREASAPYSTGAKILEFPHPITPPPTRDELADPVVDTLRILEVPEFLPPPPALGGILIEPAEAPSQERRPGFELPLQPAPMARRILASMIDTLFVLTGFTLFAYVFFRMTAIMPPLRLMAGVSPGIIFLLWVGYQYLLLVYSGTTLGLKLAGLRVSQFDGRSVPRRIRRWRVIASVLSGLSLGLGYAWCFLDEDRLCWHDRITRTYMAPGTLA